MQVCSAGAVPLLVVHGAVTRLACQPLAHAPCLIDHHAVISYDRRGYGRSPRPVEPLSIGSQAMDALGVVEAAGSGPVVVIGHSYGATIALELARMAPHAIRALVLVEPAVLDVPSAGAAAAALGQAGERFHDGAFDESLSGFLETFHGAGCGERLAAALSPSWREQALADYGTYWNHELPAFMDWRLDRCAAKDVRHPVLLVGGELSHPAFHETRARLQAWLPGATSLVLAGANHDLPASHPRQLAGAICGLLGCSGADHRLPPDAESP